MKAGLYLILFAVFFKAIQTKSTRKQLTKISFVIQQSDAFKKDVIRIKMMFKTHDASLEELIDDARELIAETKKNLKNFCEEYKTVNQNCDDLLKLSNIEIEPQYQKLEGFSSFKRFTLSFEVSAVVQAVNNIGVIVDELMGEGEVTFESMKWETYNLKEKEEDLMWKGRKKAIDACNKLGLEMHQITHVDVLLKQKEVKKQEKKRKAEEEEEEEEEESEPTKQISKAEQKPKRYKFTVLCQQKDKSSQAKSVKESKKKKVKK